MKIAVHVKLAALVSLAALLSGAAQNAELRVIVDGGLISASFTAASASDVFAATAGGIMVFTERVLPRASEVWVQASLEQRQRLLQSLNRSLALSQHQFTHTERSSPCACAFSPSRSGQRQ
jgi:hypothetical protein